MREWFDRGGTQLQQAAHLFGLVFLAVGVIGFIPGITTNYDDLTRFDGPGAEVIGLFGVNLLENVVHLLYGVAGLALASSWASARLYFLGGGIIYLVVAAYGFAIDLTSSANFIGVNTAANWLHLLLGVVMLAVGYFLARDAGAERPLAA